MSKMVSSKEGSEVQKYVWEGAIPLQIHLHDSEVTTLPPPPSALILAPRIGYLPLLVPQIKHYFSSALPPGEDTVWFEYEGLPLKWYIPTGVLFDILCAEPERPWNLTVHFRGYPVNFLTPCENEDCVKWSFINSLKEAAYVINGNCKNVMNMSQNDQAELWHSVLNGDLEAYLRVSNKLKLEICAGEKFNPSKTPKLAAESENMVPIKAGRIPVRLYVVNIVEDFADLEDAPRLDSWEKVSYINRPLEIHGEGNCFTLLDAVKTLLPEFCAPSPSMNESDVSGEQNSTSEVGTSSKTNDETGEISVSDNVEIKLLRIQGIEPKFEIPFAWVVNNLMNPEHFLHICVYVRNLETVIV